MRRWAKWAAAAAAALVLLLLAAAAALPYLVDTPRIQAYIATTAAQALGRPVRFSSVVLRLLPLPAVELRNLEVAEDPRFGPAPFLRLDSGRVRLKVLPLLRGQVELGDILLEKPVITIIQAPDGRLNIATLGAQSEPRQAGKPSRPGGGGGAAGAVAVARVRVDDGILVYTTQGEGKPAQYRVDDLDLTLTGGGPQLAFKGGAKLQPGDVGVSLQDGLVALGGTRTLTEATLRGKVAIDGKDLGPLAAVLMGPTPALGGGVKGTLALGGTVGAPTAAGTIEISKLTATQTSPQCPEPKRRTLTIPSLTLNTSWQEQRLTGRPLALSLDRGTVTTQLTVTLDQGVRVQLADLAIKTLPLEKVLVDYLCQGYAITGPLDLTGGLSFAARDAMGTLSGPGQLRVGAGRVVGSQALALIGGVVRVGGAISSILSADLPARVFESPLEFDSITGTYTLTNGVATTRDLLYTSRAMKVAIAGDYSLPTTRMNIDMVITHGRGEVQAKVTGTTASPSIRVSPAAVLRDVDPQKAQKGIQDLLKRFGR
jgi:AsmA family/AsmA-like C-terminal region